MENEMTSNTEKRSADLFGFEIQDCEQCKCMGWKFNEITNKYEDCDNCNGNGRVYTRAGKVAKDTYFKSMELPVSKVRVGYMIYPYPQDNFDVC